MAPRTRHSQILETANNTPARNPNPVQLGNSTNKDITPNQHGRRRQAANTSQKSVNVQEGRKRTISSTHTNVNTTTATHTTSETAPTKRARNTGPPRARPLQLRILSSDVGGMESQLPQSGVSAAATAAAGVVSMEDNRRPLQRMDAFYGALPQDPPPRIHRNQNSPSGFLSSDADSDVQRDGNSDTEPDDDQEMIELAQKQPSKFQEALRLERPSWRTSDSTPIGSQTGETPARILRKHQDNSMPASPASASVARTSKTWPRETELVVSAKGKINISTQTPVIRVLIQDAIERARVSLLFVDAFPNANTAILVAWECVTDAAEKFKPGTSVIYERLMSDKEYLTKMASVPRARMPLFRHELKEYCDVLVSSFFSPMKDDPDEIIAVVAKQTYDYYYIYPRAPNSSSLVLRMRPYRNDRIIMILQHTYFSGGPKSFAARFEHRFDTFEERDGTISYEVPVPMLALVATALFAAIYEWREGVHKSTHFTSEAYIDVYRGNYNTIKGIEGSRKGAYHRMMSDIYSLASNVTAGNVVTSRMQTASIDLDDLEE